MDNDSESLLEVQFWLWVSHEVVVNCQLDIG